ncbi:MAG: sigma-54-dependent Fis family transcriptional regulator [Candidatus Omnitrophica bacterium]|nr:sigma-54-dependent Fis family transcriptional regulator [Candidatus Omnitrophota bacterium]
MKASDLKLDEIVEFSEGCINLQGRRLVLSDIHTLAQFRKDLVDMLGPDHTRRFLTRYGYFWGQADAAAMKRIYTWNSMSELIRAGFRLCSLEGAARTVVKKLDIDQSENKFYMEIVWHRSAESEEQMTELGKSDESSCWKLVGYASGYASYCLGQDIFFVESKCRSKGDRICSAVGMDRASWGDPFKEHFMFFQQAEINSKIQYLTKEIQRKKRQIYRQNKKIEQLEQRKRPYMSEIRSKAFQQVYDMAQRVARYDSLVLITGESGSGKEVLARFIHNHSKRAKGPFLAVNCSSLSETLLESELFGHVKGAFTGAIRDRVGLFEQAKKGTLLLDEIGDISSAMQVKLLRVLQESEILRVGESQPHKIDARIICATNRNLPEMVEKNQFREDLYYRVGVIEIDMPPLRDRREDIIPLSRYFVNQFAHKLGTPNLKLDASCMDYLLSYSWPGNIRELENAIERAAVFSKNGLILPEHFPPNIYNRQSMGPFSSAESLRPLEEIEGEYIQYVLKSVHGSRSKAADILGISPATLWRKLKKIDVQKSSPMDSPSVRRSPAFPV